MKKSLQNKIFPSRGRELKCMLGLFILSLLLPISVLGQNKVFNLELKEKSVTDALLAINRLSGNVVIFRKEETDKETQKVTLNLSNTTAITAVRKCLKETSLICKELDSKIMVIPVAKNSFTLSGVVLNRKKETVTGATVLIKGTSKGAITDQNGLFSFMVEPGNEIEVSFVGMKTSTEKITKQNSKIVITLLEDEMAVEDVLVTGYQNISKERATGSFDFVNKKSLDKPAVSLSSRLIGSTAGMQAFVDDAGKATFEIRGRSTLYANKEPLIVVDGFPIVGGFDAINPNDVASVTILKDAAAASIWGARSANGVIVITTKKGNEGQKLNVSFNVFYKVRSRIDLDYANPMANSSDHIAYEEHIFGKYGAVLNSSKFNSTDFVKPYTLAHAAINEERLGNISTIDKNKIFDELRKIDYKDDVNEYLLQNPMSLQGNLSISGGNERTQFSSSILYDNDKAHFQRSGSDRVMLNFNMGSNITKWLKLDLSSMFQYTNEKNDGTTLKEISALSPYEKLVNADGSYTNISNKYYIPVLNRLPLNDFPYNDWVYNPLQESRGRDLKTKGFNTRMQAGLTFNLLKGLTFNSSLQLELFNGKTDNLYDESTFMVRDLVNYYTEYDNATQKVGRSGYPKGDILDKSSNERFAYIIRNQVNFNRSFSKHSINMILGTEINSQKYTTHISPRIFGYNKETLTTRPFPNGVGGTGTNALKNIFGSSYKINSYTSTLSENNQRFFSLYGNAAYTFNDKYTISASARTDASNFITDDPKYRYAPLWSVGGMWSIGKEDFMRSLKFIDRLQIRGTFGYNGNVDTSTSFKPLISLDAVADPDRNEITAYFSSLGNPSLRWEKVASSDIGIDFSFWGTKLYGKLDYYRKHGKDLIASISIPSSNGTTSEKFNDARIINKGFEMELGTNIHVSKRIDVNVNLTYAYNSNKVAELFTTDNRAVTYLNRNYKEGMNTSALYMFQYLGVNDKGIPEVAGIDGKPQPMNALYQNSIDAREWVRSPGVSVAPHVMGLNLGISLYNFDLSMVVVGKFGHKFTRSMFNYPITEKKMWVHKDAMKVINKDASVVPLLPNEADSGLEYYAQYNNSVSQGNSTLSFNYESANHIRFQELNVTYNIPDHLLSKIGFDRVSIYAQLNNFGLITATKYDLDPEFKEGTIRPTKSYLFGIKLNF